MANPTTVTVTATLSDLARYDSLGLQLFATPGSGIEPYWERFPQYMYDERVATPNTFGEKLADIEGWDWDGFENEFMREYVKTDPDKEVSIKVEMPAFENYMIRR